MRYVIAIEEGPTSTAPTRRISLAARQLGESEGEVRQLIREAIDAHLDGLRAATVTTMNEHLSGEGDVLVMKTGDHVARTHYDLTVTHPSHGHLEHIDADIALDEHIARRLIIAGDLLTLRLSDGRMVDFYMQAVSGFGAVNVTATGGIRPATT
jgi:hypothetical protein